MAKESIHKQIVFFFKKPLVSNFDDVSTKIRKVLPKESIPAVMPFPDKVPNEIPRLTITSPELRLTVSKIRLDVYFSDRDAVELARSLSEVLVNDLGVAVNRVSLVGVSFFDGDVTVAKRNLNSTLGEMELKEVLLRINLAMKLDDIDCNNLETIDLGEIQSKSTGETRKGLLVTRDINTLVENSDTSKFTPAKIESLMTAFEQHVDKYMLVEA